MEISKEQKEAIEYYQNKEVSLSVDFDTENLLKALGITEEDSFENHQIRFKTLLNLIEKLQKENEELKSENRRLKVIRYSTEYGTENIHLITKSDLVEINTNKYFIEIQDGKFVDLKQVYQENEELKEDLKYVLNQTLGAFEKNWCIDWNFTEIREKYNLESE